MRTSTLDNVKDASSEGGVLSRPAEWWRNGRTFFTEVRNELKRVTWPSRKEVYATTLVVILVSMFFSIYLGLVDLVLGRVIHWILVGLGAA
jgi:preprotein translocase subunit SecE